MPHPLPYQGSKRRLAPRIAAHLPPGLGRFYEPFCGSAAMTLYAARHGLARHFVLGDSLGGLVALWAAILAEPDRVAAGYAALWQQGQRDPETFLRVRARWNAAREPVDLLYLLCRCVKNAVRFNAAGHFSQSADRRRLGMRPATMAAQLRGAAALLAGRATLRHADWRDCLADAGPGDFAYLDPPYQGTSEGPDRRYHAGLAPAALCEGLAALRAGGLGFALSYDGSTGGRDYGAPLPASLGLRRLLLPAGRSAQATLAGRAEETVEALYLTPPQP